MCECVQKLACLDQRDTPHARARHTAPKPPWSLCSTCRREHTSHWDRAGWLLQAGRDENGHCLLVSARPQHAGFERTAGLQRPPNMPSGPHRHPTCTQSRDSLTAGQAGGWQTGVAGRGERKVQVPIRGTAAVTARDRPHRLLTGAIKAPCTAPGTQGAPVHVPLHHSLVDRCSSSCTPLAGAPTSNPWYLLKGHFATASLLQAWPPRPGRLSGVVVAGLEGRLVIGDRF